jgi:protein arginine kinase
MKLETLLKTPCEWMRGECPSGRVVLSTRVRLARNIRGVAFPGWAKRADRQRALDQILPAVQLLVEMKDAMVETMDTFGPIEKQVLVERHLISREHAARGLGSGVAINSAQTLSVMINEEDHMRMQSLRGGLQLKEAWKLMDKVDTELESKLDYAFSPKLGYLTACPTNVGTGLRGSAMLHLPGLVIAEQMGQIVQAVTKLNLNVRGLYGEGTETHGNLFQLSNQTTIGERETDILERLNKVIHQIVEHEQNARKVLLEKRGRLVADQVGRAYGILTNCQIISSKEALNLLSLILLGIDLGLYGSADFALVDEMFVISQPAHLQKMIDQKLTAEQRDMYRADLVRERLRTLPKPKLPAVKG